MKASRHTIPAMTDITDRILAKIDRALQQIEELVRERPGNQGIEIAKASLESAKLDLQGIMPS